MRYTSKQSSLLKCSDIIDIHKNRQSHFVFNFIAIGDD
jgi:hypothetical protein